MSDEYLRLLSPITVGQTVIRNRVVFTAHAARYGWLDRNVPINRQVAYHARRAMGGAGLTIHEPIPIDTIGSIATLPADTFIRERLAPVARAVRDHGGVFVQQLMMIGAQGRSDRAGLEPLISFAGRPTPEGEGTHALTSHELRAAISQFAQVARHCIGAGAQGVELHAAHGYLLQQSFSPWAGCRTDEWADPLSMLRATIAEVRAAIGDAILGLRICIDDFTPATAGGLGPDGLIAIAADITQDGMLDYLNHSEGAQPKHYAMAVGSWRHPQGEFTPLIAQLRAAVRPDLPVIGVGRIIRPKHAEHMLTSGICDLVGMTRAQIADPDLVAKIERGEPRSIRPCIGANQGCIDKTLAGLPITCVVNPEAGSEAIAPVPKRKKIRLAVIGGGPAGLKAAETAARAGHAVTLYEAKPALGGQLRPAGKLKVAREIGAASKWLEQECRRLGVEILLDRRMTVGEVARLDADAIILATGSRAVVRNHAGRNHIDAAAAMDLTTCPGRVVVVDETGDFPGYFAAEHLAGLGANVTLVSHFPILGQHMGYTHAAEIPTVLARLGCALIPSHQLASSSGRAVLLRSLLDGRERRLACDLLVTAATALPAVDLLDAVARHGAVWRVIGDAHTPRTALHAIRMGFFSTLELVSAAQEATTEGDRNEDT